MSNDSELHPSLCTINQEIFTELLRVKHCEECKGTTMNKQTPYSWVAYHAVENKNIGKRIGKITCCNYSEGNVALWKAMSWENPRVKLGVFTAGRGSSESKGWELGGGCAWRKERGDQGVLKEWPVKSERGKQKLYYLFISVLSMPSEKTPTKIKGQSIGFLHIFLLDRYCDGRY